MNYLEELISGYLSTDVKYIKKYHYFVTENKMFDTLYSLFIFLGLDDNDYHKFMDKFSIYIPLIEKLRLDSYMDILLEIDDFLSYVEYKEKDEYLLISSEKISMFRKKIVKLRKEGRIFILKNFAGNTVGISITNKDGHELYSFSFDYLIDVPIWYHNLPNIYLDLTGNTRYINHSDMAYFRRRHLKLFSVLSSGPSLNIRTKDHITITTILDNPHILWLLNGNHYINGMLFSDFILSMDRTLSQSEKMVNLIEEIGVKPFISDEFNVELVKQFQKYNKWIRTKKDELLYSNTKMHYKIPFVLNKVIGIDDKVHFKWKINNSFVESYTQNSVEVVEYISEQIANKNINSIVFKQKDGKERELLVFT